MDVTALIIGTLTALGTALSVHLIWREKKSPSSNSLHTHNGAGIPGSTPFTSKLVVKGSLNPHQETGTPPKEHSNEEKLWDVRT